MRRRDFLTAAAATAAPAMIPGLIAAADKNLGRKEDKQACCGATYASPEEAMKAPREKLLYATALYVGTETKKPDYLATIDVDPDSPTIRKSSTAPPCRTWATSCTTSVGMLAAVATVTRLSSRRFIVLPGLLSGRIHILDAADPAAPKLSKTIEPERIAAETNLALRIRSTAWHRGRS